MTKQEDKPCASALRTDGMPSCHAGRDGDCYWEHCPQNRDGEPSKTGRNCPLPHWTEDEDY